MSTKTYLILCNNCKASATLTTADSKLSEFIKRRDFCRCSEPSIKAYEELPLE